MRCVIFSWSECRTLPVEIKSDDLIICADIGLKTAERFKIEPNIVVGDFDSYEKGKTFEGQKIFLPVEKDDTDTFYAVKSALEKGCDEIVIVGGVGGEREDHTFANVATLKYIRKHGAKGYIITDKLRIDFVSNETLRIPYDERIKTVSVFAMTEEALITEEGLYYTVENYLLSQEIPIGVSNHQLKDTDSVIKVYNGDVIVFSVKS